MFIILLDYIVPLEQVDGFLEEHVCFLKKQYEKKVFIASGRKIPRTGGVILAKAKNEKEINAIIEQDPFFKNRIATYSVTEFLPSMTLPEFNGLNELDNSSGHL